jgi:hypothetical protein
MNGAGALGALLLFGALGRVVGLLLGFEGVALRWWVVCLVGFYLLSVAVAYWWGRLPRLISEALADADAVTERPQPVQVYEGPVDPELLDRWGRVVASMSPAAGGRDASLSPVVDSPTAEHVMPRVVRCTTCPTTAPATPAGTVPAGWAQVSGVVWCWRCSGGVPQ